MILILRININKKCSKDMLRFPGGGLTEADIDFQGVA